MRVMILMKSNNTLIYQTFKTNQKLHKINSKKPTVSQRCKILQPQEKNKCCRKKPQNFSIYKLQHSISSMNSFIRPIDLCLLVFTINFKFFLFEESTQDGRIKITCSFLVAYTTIQLRLASWPAFLYCMFCSYNY